MILVILDALLAILDLGLGISYLAIGKTVIGIIWCLCSPVWGWIAYMNYKHEKGRF